jgi:hypothetical protein
MLVGRKAFATLGVLCVFVPALGMLLGCSPVASRG